jgi:hypothetical protein
MFNFEGSTKLISIDVSDNSMHGRIPESWLHLNECNTLKASHNMLESTVQTLVGMKKLEVLELGHNLITFEKKNFLEWFSAIIPASCVIADLSHNLLVQPPDAAPSERFILSGVVAQKWASMIYVDLSYNSLEGWINLVSRL